MNENKRRWCFHLGWRLGILAGCFPLVVGTINYLNIMLPVLFPEQVILFYDPFGYLKFSYRVRQLGGEFADYFFITGQVGYANLVGNSVVMLALIYFGIRRRLWWSWWICFFMLVWVGGNDLMALLRYRILPLPVIPVLLGLFCQVLTLPEILTHRATRNQGIVDDNEIR